MAQRILVVDDDPHIRDVIAFALTKAGFVTDSAINGGEALRLFRQAPPDLIVLDVGMPDTDGLEVCRQVRRSSEVPILFLSARDDEIDRVLGLEIGGDDYVTKPFSPRELVARVKIILRRAAAAPLPEMRDAPVLRHGRLLLDPEAHRAEFEGRDLALTAIEFSILQTLLGRPRTVFSRDRIMTAAYGANVTVADRTIDSHIRNIRAKAGGAGCRDAIETVHGVGFRAGPCTGAT